MKHISYFLVLCSACLICLFSCRKKEERYEGYYTGTERYTLLDSGTVEFSIDTIYSQEIEVTYSKKMYSFLRQLNPPNNAFTISRKDIKDHQYLSNYDGGKLIFSGDSMYIYSSNFSDYITNWDSENWVFEGKRN